MYTAKASTSEMNRLETDRRASCGHSWNQLMAVQLTMEGNLRARTRNVAPTGEKQSTTCVEAKENTNKTTIFLSIWSN